jgi:hypothetical protein
MEGEPKRTTPLSAVPELGIRLSRWWVHGMPASAGQSRHPTERHSSKPSSSSSLEKERWWWWWRPRRATLAATAGGGRERGGRRGRGHVFEMEEPCMARPEPGGKGPHTVIAALERVTERVHSTALCTNCSSAPCSPLPRLLSSLPMSGLEGAWRR